MWTRVTHEGYKHWPPTKNNDSTVGGYNLTDLCMTLPDYNSHYLYKRSAVAQQMVNRKEIGSSMVIMDR